jgi:ferredoxin
MMNNTYNMDVRDNADCNGCGVCMLSCPVWRQSHTMALTICGRVRLAMGGAAAEDLVESARACILCGSCAALCPRGMDTQRATLALRQQLVKRGLLTATGRSRQPARSIRAASGRLFLPGAALRGRQQLLERCQQFLGSKAACLSDDGTDICHDLECGEVIEDKRLEEFLAPLRTAREIIVSDGLMVNFLSFMLGQRTRVRGLGEALLENAKVRRGVKSTDFFMVETRTFNARRGELVMQYEALRRDTGCFLNFDLHRVATPTGAMGVHYRMNLPALVSVEAQVQWLLEGRNAKRIVVEHLDDGAAFLKHTQLPVVHLAEVAEP